MEMDLHRYDIVEAELEYGSGSIQRKRRPYIIVSNEKGTQFASIITVMPLTSAKKKKLPMCCILWKLRLLWALCQVIRI